jgi:predicted metal-binding protein
MTQQKIESDLDFLCQEAKKLGAVNAVASVASDIIVDIRANLKCQVPLCPYYGNNLMCPPYIMKASEFQEILAKYTYAVLIQAEISLPEEVFQAASQENNLSDLYQNYKQSFSPTWNELNKFDEIINKIEAAAFNLGYRFAAGFSGGSCKLCDECVAKQPGESCRHPFKARPSMEAVGIDVLKTAEKAGLTATAPAMNIIVAHGMVLVD